MLSKQKIKFINSLKYNKYRLQYNCFLAEGLHVVNDFIKSDFIVIKIYVTTKLAHHFSTNFELISEKELAKISSFKNPSGVLALINKPVASLTTQHHQFNQKRIILLDSISDPGNMGTIIRTADWFGVKKIYTSKNCVDVYNPKVVQSSMGSLSRVKIQVTSLISLVNQLKLKNILSYSTTLNGNSIYDLSPPDQFALIFGNESSGVSDSLIKCSDQEIKILNSNHQIDSLNVAVAFGIILSQFR